MKNTKGKAFIEKPFSLEEYCHKSAGSFGKAGNLKMLIDSHVHLDLTLAHDPLRVEWMKNNHYLPVSWAFGSNIQSTKDLTDYLRFQQETIHRISDAGLTCYYLSGIHPRNIPPDLETKQIPKILSPYMDDPLCLGIGEIGLETGTQREMQVLSAQMEMAYTLLSKQKIFGIHTPRNHKKEITRQLLGVLDPFLSMKDALVVDHCTPETIGAVLARGYWAGITVSPLKSSEKDVRDILNAHGKYENRIMINTDAAGRFHDDLFSLSLSTGIAPSVKQRILRENAALFFRLQAS